MLTLPRRCFTIYAVVQIEIQPGKRPLWIAAGDGAVHSEFTAVIDDDHLPYRVEMRVRTSTAVGRPEIDALLLVRRDGPITTESLRRCNVSGLLRAAIAADTRPRVDNPDGTFRVLDVGEPENQAWGGPRLGPGRGRAMPADHLEQVARIYREALAAGLPPTKAVRLKMNASQSTAARWVAQARDRGFLGPAVGTQAGEAPTPKKRRAR